jgi:diguanylate cyclase (GGDEF)-like protein/PAS domain S-box-containing protein
MPKIKVIRPWLTLNTTTRMFIPILVLFAIAGSVRYELLVKNEAVAAQERFQLALRQVPLLLVPALADALTHPTPGRLESLLRSQSQANPDWDSLVWQPASQALSSSITQRSTAAMPVQYPSWLTHLVPIHPHTAHFEVPGAADSAASAGVLTIQVSPVPSLNSAWTKLRAQLWAAGLTGLSILLLMGWVAGTNSRMVRRLVSATNRFKRGDHNARMEVTGPFESRALALTFNNMANEVQSLVASLTQAQTALMNEKERAEVTLASIGDAVITTDMEGRIETLNALAQQLTGWSYEQAHGNSLGLVFELLNDAMETSAFEAAPPLYLTETVVHATNQILLHPSGERCAIEYTAAPIRQADGGAVGCVLVFRDVSEKSQLIQEISWQIGHDVLTGLHNRPAMQELFSLAILQARHHRKQLAICLLDLDHFQPVNERYGSNYGDRLLQAVASRLTQYAGDDHGLARLGGDEFVLLLKDQNDQAEVLQQVAKVQALLSAPYVLDGHTINLTSSIGIAIYPQDEAPLDTNLDILLRHADQAMVQAKQTGRNRFHVFDAQLDQEVHTHHQQRTRVRQAMLDGELRLYYQPKVNMRSGQVFGMEALLRWQHPQDGLLGPYHFLPLVENTDVIIDIGEWVLLEALQQMQRWAAQGQHWVVSVNIAARHFQQPDFVERLASILARVPEVSPQMLELEILESAALEDVQHMRNVMASCQKLGVQFALDDFGTGYSSLAYLKRLPANTLKIDQSFVRDMLDDPDDLTLVDAIVGLAKAFDRGVIAEGVETIAHGLLLLQLGCDWAQGYGIARPMPAEAVADWASRFTSPEAWRVWGAMPWAPGDFPLLLAAHDHQAWVQQIADIASTEGQSEQTASYPERFSNWYLQRGQAEYGHQSEFAAVGTHLQSLRSAGLEVLRLQITGASAEAKAQLPRLQQLQASFAQQLDGLLSACAETAGHQPSKPLLFS